MSNGPKTREEAMALPEVPNLLTGGFFLGGSGVEDDTIIQFVDVDGISKTVECIRRTKDGPDEWVKSPFYL